MHLTQSRTSKCCGQTCLAMLAGCSVSEAVAAVGHRRCTRPVEIITAAKRLGLKPLAKFWTTPSEAAVLPGKAIVRMRRKRRHWSGGHWCCIVDGVFHDPLSSEPGKLGTNDLIVCWMAFG